MQIISSKTVRGILSEAKPYFSDGKILKRTFLRIGRNPNSESVQFYGLVPQRLIGHPVEFCQRDLIDQKNLLFV